jgi:general stress protein 26
MSTTTEKSYTEKRDSLQKIVEGAQTAFFVTEASHALHGRPMANAKVEKNLQSIWFATRRDSGKIAQIKQDQQVLLGYTNASGSEWASINATANLVEDKAKIKELWSPLWKNWFEGPDDPAILLIQVMPHSAEYWDSGSKAIAMIKFALAAVTGKKFNEGENARVEL